jgi:hypothetical protein
VILTEQEYQISAKRISAYFEYWYLAKNESPSMFPMNFSGTGPIISIHGPNSTTVPDVNNYVVVGNVDAHPALNAVVVQPPHTGGSVIEYLESQGKKILVINGSDNQMIEQATSRLLEILDDKYSYTGAMSNGPMYIKAGIANEPLE